MSRRRTPAITPWWRSAASGAMIEDVDGNVFLDFAAGIAVCATGHCHPDVVAAIQKQAAELIHLSGTDFYYEGMPQLAEKLSSISPGAEPKRVYFGNSGAEAIEAAIKLVKYHTKRDKLIAFNGVVSWTHDGRAFVDGEPLGAAQGIWDAAFRRVSHAVSGHVSRDVWRAPGERFGRLLELSGK